MGCKQTFDQVAGRYLPHEVATATNVEERWPMVVDEWIRRYAKAWEAADADAAVSLFTPTASYHSNVFRKAHVGAEEIRAYWTQATRTQRGVIVELGRPILAHDRCVVEWWATMAESGQGEITLPGCLLLRFDRNGRCNELWEYWQVERGKHMPPPGWGS